MVLKTDTMGTRKICSLVAHTNAGPCHLHLTGITDSVQNNQQMVLQIPTTSKAMINLRSRSGQSGLSRSALLTWYASEAAVAAASSLALGTRGPSRCMTTALAMAPMTDLQLAPTRRLDTSVRTRNFVSCSLRCKKGIPEASYTQPTRSLARRISWNACTLFIIVIFTIIVVIIILVVISIVVVIIIVYTALLHRRCLSHYVKHVVQRDRESAACMQMHTDCLKA